MMKNIIKIDDNIIVDFGENKKSMNAKIIFLLLVLTGCQSGNQESGRSSELPVIDISKTYPEKTINLNEITEKEYIKLETTDDVLLSEYSIIFHVSEKYILLFDGRRNDIFIFSREGKIITHFNRKGQGGEEYIGISKGSVVFDEKNEEIYVFARDRILIYSLNGEFKRKFTPPDVEMIEKTHIFDDETLLVYYGYRQYIDKSLEKKIEYPYKLISKTDGRIITELDIKLPARYSNYISMRVELSDRQMGYTSDMIPIFHNMQWGKDYVIADRSSDTIYKLQPDRELTPILVRKPSVHSSDPRTIWTSYFATDKFIVLQTTNLDLKALEKGIKSPPVTLLHDFETGETNRVLFHDEAFYWEDWLPYPVMVGSHVMPKNTTVKLVQASFLKYAYQRNGLRGELKDLASTLDEDDNPVVVIYTFK